MKTPFALPVRMEGDFLVAADCELISSISDATDEERAHIVKAVNAYPKLVATLHLIRAQSLGDDWTAEQAMAWAKDYVGEVLTEVQA